MKNEPAQLSALTWIVLLCSLFGSCGALHEATAAKEHAERAWINSANLASGDKPVRCER